MAKPGFNFTFGPSTPAQQPAQPASQAAAGQKLQVPSFNFGQTASTATTPGISFGNVASSTPANSATPVATPGFGVAPVNATVVKPVTIAATTQPTIGFPGFGSSTTPAATATATTSQPTSQPTIGLSFPSAAATSAPATTSATVSPFQVPAVAASSAAPTAPTGLNLAQTLASGATASTTAATTTAAAATTTIGGTTVGPKTAMKFGELEQLVASRRAELEQAGRAFVQLAAVLANRDAELRRSAVKLVAAESELDRLKMTAETLDRELDYADTQTTELENVVDDIERQLAGVGGTTTPADESIRHHHQQQHALSGVSAGGDRSSTLQMAVAVDAQLRASARQLRSLSERVNSVTGAAAMVGLNQRDDTATGQVTAGGASSSGMATLMRLLDSQLRLLEWVEASSSQLQRRIDALSNRTSASGGHAQLSQSVIIE